MVDISNSTVADIGYASAIAYCSSNIELTPPHIAKMVFKKDPSNTKTLDSIRKDITNIASNIFNNKEIAKKYPLWQVRNENGQWYITIKPSNDRVFPISLLAALKQFMTPNEKYDVRIISDLLARKFIKRYTTMREYLISDTGVRNWTGGQVYSITNTDGITYISRKEYKDEREAKAKKIEEAVTNLIEQPQSDIIFEKTKDFLNEIHLITMNNIKELQKLSDQMKATGLIKVS